MSKETKQIRVVELFAGVGGFRLGLEQASSNYKVVWSNQWEPATKTQDASLIYAKRFGEENHSNQDIAMVQTNPLKNNYKLFPITCPLRPTIGHIRPVIDFKFCHSQLTPDIYIKLVSIC